jgi:hypothetical protein
LFIFDLLKSERGRNKNVSFNDLSLGAVLALNLGLGLARKALYHMSHASRLLALLNRILLLPRLG